MRQHRKIITEMNDEQECIQLWEHRIGPSAEYELVINGVFIMATYNSLSSELLVRHPVEQSRKPDLALLIGGLGLGYSVREACAHDQVASIHVVELSRHVIGLNETTLKDLNGKYLEDRRVNVTCGDFVEYVGQTHCRYDIICMDIDNGPMLLVREGNEGAYTREWFCKVKRILNSGGGFAVWSCNRDDALLRDLAAVFSDCHIREVWERHSGRDVPYYLYFAC